MNEAIPPPASPIVAIRPGARFDGVIVLHRAARIDGRVRGQILGRDAVWIGEEARVEARVDAEEIVVAGEVLGDLRGRRRVELRETGRVRGSVISPKVALAEGSRLEGRCLAGAAAENDAAP